MANGTINFEELASKMLEVDSAGFDMFTESYNQRVGEIYKLTEPTTQLEGDTTTITTPDKQVTVSSISGDPVPKYTAEGRINPAAFEGTNVYDVATEVGQYDIADPQSPLYKRPYSDEEMVNVVNILAQEEGKNPLLDTYLTNINTAYPEELAAQYNTPGYQLAYSEDGGLSSVKPENVEKQQRYTYEAAPQGQGRSTLYYRRDKNDPSKYTTFESVDEYWDDMVRYYNSLGQEPPVKKEDIPQK
jgi:hypothetical protein